MRQGRFDDLTGSFYILDETGYPTGEVLVIEENEPEEDVFAPQTLSDETQLDPIAPLSVPEVKTKPPKEKRFKREKGNKKDKPPKGERTLFGVKLSDLSEAIEEEAEHPHKAHLSPKEILAHLKANWLAVRTADIPQALEVRSTKHLFFALGVLLFCLFLTIYEKDPRYLSGILISLGLVYLAYSALVSFVNGDVEEIAVMVTDFVPLRGRGKTKVVFATDGTPPKYYSFVLPSREAERFNLNEIYIIYIHRDQPGVLLGYSAL